MAELRALRHAAVDASYGSLLPAAAPVASIVDHRVPVRDGVVRVRVYRPHGDGRVPTALHRWPGQVHGSQLLAAVLPDEAAAHLELITGALRDAYSSVAQHASSDT